MTQLNIATNFGLTKRGGINMILVEKNVGNLVSAYHTNRYDPNDLVALADQIQKAGEFIEGHTSNQLMQILDQIRTLQQQAHTVLAESARNTALHQCACNLVKRVGCIYHFYERPSGQKFLSLLSPSEWGAGSPHKHIGSYRLESDQSWTPLDQIPSRDERKALVTRLITHNAITDT